MLKEGLDYTTERIVDKSNLAVTMGSGDLEVLATPALVAAMENAAMLAVADALEPTDTTVGGHIDMKHLRPTPLGEKFTAYAKVVRVEGKKIEYSLIAEDGKGVIGEGTHTRFVVNREKFMSRL